MRRGWTQCYFPADVRHEIAIWLATPGIEAAWHVHNLRIHHATLKKYQAQLPGFEDLREEVAENWLSATRDDCINLARMRPGKTSGVPLLAQLSMLGDLKKGMRPCDIASEYGVTSRWLYDLTRFGVRVRDELPSGFELLAA